MDRPTVYIETTVVSYLAARPSRDPVTARKQAATREWWSRRDRFSLRVSSTVLEESAQGDPIYAARRLALLDDIPVLAPMREIDLLGAALLEGSGLPSRTRPDASHVAHAAAHGVAYLVSWDRAHITNPLLMVRMERICREHGYHLPILCSPDRLPKGRPR